MRRYTLLVWGSMALSALSLAPVLLGQATAADKPSASPADAAKRKMAPATIPEDGIGADDFPASSRLVRDVIKSRPSVDLIICVAGCRPGNDRVVYAQPSDPKSLPAVAAPEQAPQPVAEQPAVDKPTESAASEDGPKAKSENADDIEKAASQEVAPAAGGEAEAEAQAKPDATEEGRMEPTAAEPEAPSEPASDKSSEDAPSESAGEPEAMPDGDGDGDGPADDDGARGE